MNKIKSLYTTSINIEGFNVSDTMNLAKSLLLVKDMLNCKRDENYCSSRYNSLMKEFEDIMNGFDLKKKEEKEDETLKLFKL
ncbi:hypothetical protein KKH23_10770 [Patescibacteria group bacterium]|nr:hypothetical protein [Patescibacteria group bacterium]